MNIVNSMLENFDRLTDDELFILDKLESEKELTDAEREILFDYAAKMHLPGVPGEKEYEIPDDIPRPLPFPKKPSKPVPEKDPIPLPIPAKVTRRGGF